MSTAWGPSHLLLFYQPLGDELVDRRFHKARRNTFSTSLTLPVVDQKHCCRYRYRILQGREPISSIPSGRPASPRDLQSRRPPQTSGQSASHQRGIHCHATETILHAQVL